MHRCSVCHELRQKYWLTEVTLNHEINGNRSTPNNGRVYNGKKIACCMFLQNAAIVRLFSAVCGVLKSLCSLIKQHRSTCKSNFVRSGKMKETAYTFTNNSSGAEKLYSTKLINNWLQFKQIKFLYQGTSKHISLQNK